MQWSIWILEKDSCYLVDTHLIIVGGGHVSLPSCCRKGGECRSHKRTRCLAKSDILIKSPIRRRNPVSKNQAKYGIFIKILSGEEIEYKKIKIVALAVVVASQKFRRYFLAHSIVVQTDFPLRQVLYWPNMVGDWWIGQLVCVSLKFPLKRERH